MWIPAVLALVASPALAQDRAWQQEAPYLAPDLEAYFPDDEKGGLHLDELWDQGQLKGLVDGPYLQAIRQGLRHTTQHRTLILADLGNRFIWGQDPQHPDAIELCYHAADFGEAARRYGTRHYAVYFGLSVVKPKTPAILRTLAELCVEIDDPNDLGRVAWGAADQIDELLPYLDPYRDSVDPWVLEKVTALDRIFGGEIGAFAWAAERSKLPPRPRPWTEMPEVRSALQHGNSEVRLAMLERIREEGLGEQMNESYLADYAAAATDPSAEVRRKVARQAGNTWIWRAGLHRIAPEAVDLLLQLSRDGDPGVREDAIYYGVSTCRGSDERIPRRLIEVATRSNNESSRKRAIWGLGKFKERAKGMLEADLESPDRSVAHGAYALYLELFEEPPAKVPAGIPSGADLEGTWKVTVFQAGKPSPLGDSLIVERDGQGQVQVYWSDFRGESLPIEGLATFVAGEVLYFDFHFTIETVELRVNGQLSKDRIEGAVRMRGQDKLYPWSAERLP